MFGRGIHRVVPILIAALFVPLAGPVAAQPGTDLDGDYTSLRFYDSTGYFVTKGEVRTLTPQSGTITGTSLAPNRAGVGWKRGFTEYWGVSFDAGTEKTLAVGTYSDTTPGDPFNNPEPSLSFGGPGRSCEDTGTFTIHQIERAGDGTLAKLSATFELCGAGAPTLFGSVAYHADQPAQPVPHGPPDPPSNIGAVGSGRSLTLSWTNPAQSFADVVIRRAPNSVPPATVNDGDLVYVGNGTSVRLDGLEPFTTYAFSFFGRNAEGTVGPRATLTTRGTRLYDAQARQPMLEFGTSTLIEALLQDSDTSGQVARPVQLWSRVPGTSAWAALAVANTDGQGYIGFQVTPARSTEYRLTFAGAENLIGAESPALLVKVAPLLKLRAPTSAKLGTTYTITVTMKPAAAGTKLQLLEKRPRKPFRKIATAKVNKKGVATFKVTRTQKAKYSYVGYNPATRTFDEAWSSKAATVKVK